MWLLKWGAALSAFIAFVIAYVILFLVPKGLVTPADVASYGLLSAVAAFLLVAAFVWVLAVQQAVIFCARDAAGNVLCARQ